MSKGLQQPMQFARKKQLRIITIWVDAAAAMGCHSIRVNLAGSKVPENGQQMRRRTHQLAATQKTKTLIFCRTMWFGRQMRPYSAGVNEKSQYGELRGPYQICWLILCSKSRWF